MKNLNQEGVDLLNAEKINEFNNYRIHNLVYKPNLDNQDFSGKNLSFAFLNGAICNNTNFSHCILKKTNLVPSGTK